MPTRTHSRPHPATPGGVGMKLPWWSLALPALAFLALLALILNPSDAHAAGGAPATARLLEHAHRLLAR